MLSVALPMAMSWPRVAAADASPTCRAKAMTIQAASIAAAMIATRRRVMPTIGQRREVAVAAGRRPSPSRSSASGRGRRRRGHRGWSRRDIGGSVATLQLRCQPTIAVTANLSSVRLHARARLPPFRTSVRLHRSLRRCAPMPPPTPRRSSIACSRSRRSPRGVVHHAVLPPREARPSPPMPPWLDPRIVAGLAKRGIERLYIAPGRGDRGGPRRRGRRRRHADRVGQDALLRAARPAGHRRGPGGAGAVPVPDQGPRPGPGDRVRRARRRRPACRSSTSTYDGDTPAPIRSAVRAAGQVVVTQPGHAPLGDPAAPHQVVPAVRAAPAHRHRRAAHVPRRLRRPRRERPAAAAADLRPLRQPAGHRLLLRDDREPGRARGDADRATGTASSTATARRPASATSCSSTRRCIEPASGARGSAVTLAQRWALPFLRAGRQTIVFGRSRVAVELLLTGLRESLRESYGPRSRVRGYRGGYLPTERRAIERGLRDGEILGVVSTNALELGVDIGRLDVVDPGRLPGLGRRRRGSSSAGPAGGRARASRPRRVRRPGRPVRHPPPGVPAREHARGGAARPGQPARPARAPARRDLRAAVRARRGVRTRRRPTTSWRSSPRKATSARRATGAGTGRARTSRRRRSRCGRPRRRTS